MNGVSELVSFKQKLSNPTNHDHAPREDRCRLLLGCPPQIEGHREPGDEKIAERYDQGIAGTSVVNSSIAGCSADHTYSTITLLKQAIQAKPQQHGVQISSKTKVMAESSFCTDPQGSVRLT